VIMSARLPRRCVTNRRSRGSNKGEDIDMMASRDEPMRIASLTDDFAGLRMRAVGTSLRAWGNMQPGCARILVGSRRADPNIASREL